MVSSFSNLSGSAVDEWIGDGIAQTLASDLQSSWEITVLDRQALRRTAPGVDAQMVDELAALRLSRDLGAEWLIAGAYQRVGDRLRITARLVGITTGTVRHSVIVDGTVSELFALQDQVVDALGGELATTSGVPDRVEVLTSVPPEPVVGAGLSPGIAPPILPAGVLTAPPLVIDGSPPPEAPDIVARDATGPTTVGAIRLTEPLNVNGGLAPGTQQYNVEPPRIDQGPQLDGVLNDEVWLSAAVIDDFIQQEPSEGDPATERTVVRLAYDGQALYIGVEAFDSVANEVIATEMRRDSERLFDEDNFQIILDTFHDSRSGYMFVTNPVGGKLEQQVAEEGEGAWGNNSPNINVDWDGVWHVATRRTSEGWVAEIAIPMVTLRFPEAERQVWGVNFMRNIRRKNEQVYWAPIPKAYNLTRVSLAGTLSGISSVDRGMDLRVTPYVSFGGRQDRAITNLDGSGFSDLGADVKYGLASGLNLDLTLNTDFAQVEVDEQQVNLTRFPLFFPEKRDFFLENAGMFNVKMQGWNRAIDLFFTRRIGLSDTGQPVPIFGGARLTGKVDRHNIAVLNIQTQEAFGQPGENFFVSRYSRDVFARSKVGGLIVNKETVGGSEYNRTFAADTSLALHPNFTVASFIAKTQTPGISTDDMAGHMRASWLSPSWRFFGEYTDIQGHFNPEVGFVPRVGIRTTNLHAEWNPRPGRWNIRYLDPMLDYRYTTDQDNRLVSKWFHHMIAAYFENGASFTWMYNKNFEQLDIPFPIRSDVTIPAGAYRFADLNFSYRSDPSRRFYHELRYSPQTFFDGTRTDWSATLGLRASSRIAAEGRFQRSEVEGPWGAFVADLGLLRFDLALSPEATLRTLSQYNSSTHEVSTSVRFNWIYRPGSDIYIAYDESRMDMDMDMDPLRLNPHTRRSLWLRNRQLAIKMTYLWSR